MLRNVQKIDIFRVQIGDGRLLEHGRLLEILRYLLSYYNLFKERWLYSVIFQAILGPKFGPIPNGKIPPFFSMAQINSQSEVEEKSGKKFVFRATKTNDIAIFPLKTLIL